MHILINERFFEIPKVKLDQLNVKLNVLKDSLDT